jgi:hypothetical protein
LSHSYSNNYVHAVHNTEDTTYIRWREHHQKMTFEEEFLALLKKAGVSCDPTHVFG